MTATVRFDKWENTATTKSVTMDQIAGGSGLVPIVPTSVDKGSGTASIGANGLVSFAGVNTISLNNVFNSTYKTYRVLIKLHGQSAAGVLYMRMRAGSTDFSGSNYHGGGYYGRTNATGGWTGSSNESAYQVLQYVTMTDWTLSSTIDIFDPNAADETTFIHSSWNYDGSGPYGMARNGMLYNTSQFDGLSLITTAGTVSGTAQVYGYR